MLIKVTPHHIEKGLPCHNRRCPIALALEDKGFTEICVSRHSIEYKVGDIAKIFYPAYSVTRWIELFDFSDPRVRPVDIELVDENKKARIL